MYKEKWHKLFNNQCFKKVFNKIKLMKTKDKKSKNLISKKN